MYDLRQVFYRVQWFYQ